MRLALFQTPAAAEILPGVITEHGVVDISSAVRKSYTPQLAMQGIIDDFEKLRPALEKLCQKTEPLSRLKKFACGRRYRGPEKFSPASPTTGSTRSESRARSTCS